MRPVLPDTPALQDLMRRSEEDLRSEVETAVRFRQAADTYLAWAQLSQQLKAQWAALRPGPPGQVVRLGVAQERDEALPITVGNGAKPSLRRAIILVMMSDPNRVWAKREIFAALKENGWEPRGGKPSSQLATRLAEMIERGEVERVSYGHYRLTTGGDQEELREASAIQIEEAQ